MSRQLIKIWIKMGKINLLWKQKWREPSELLYAPINVLYLSRLIQYLVFLCANACSCPSIILSLILHIWISFNKLYIYKDTKISGRLVALDYPLALSRHVYTWEAKYYAATKFCPFPCLVHLKVGVMFLK